MIYLEDIISAMRLACSEGMYDPDAAQDAEDELRRLSPMEAQLASAKRAFKDEHALLTIVEAQLADEKLHVKQLERGLDKLLAVNKVLERSHKLMMALVLDDESKATKEQLAESVEICKALNLAGEIK